MADTLQPPDDNLPPDSTPSPFDDFINRHLDTEGITDGTDYEFILGDPDGNFQFADRLWVRRQDQTRYVLYWRADLLQTDDDEDDGDEGDDPTTDENISVEEEILVTPTLPPDKPPRPLWRTLLDLLVFIGLVAGFILFFELFGDSLPFARRERERQAQAQQYQATIEALIATIEADQPRE